MQHDNKKNDLRVNLDNSHLTTNKSGNFLRHQTRTNTSDKILNHFTNLDDNTILSNQKYERRVN